MAALHGQIQATVLQNTTADVCLDSLPLVSCLPPPPQRLLGAQVLAPNVLMAVPARLARFVALLVKVGANDWRGRRGSRRSQWGVLYACVCGQGGGRMHGARVAVCQAACG